MTRVLVTDYVRAVSLARQVAAEGWQTVAASRLAAAAGNELWSDLDRKWKPRHCRELASLAQTLSSWSGSPISVVEELMARGRASRQARLGKTLLRFAAATYLQPGAYAGLLRGAGITLCTIHGRLDSCQCLKDLADDVGLLALQSALTTVCLDYLRS